MKRDSLDEALRRKLHDAEAGLPVPPWAEMQRRMQLHANAHPAERVPLFRSWSRYAAAAVSTVGKAAVPDPVAHYEVAFFVRTKGYGLLLLTPDDLPRALQIAGEQFPAAVGTFVAYGHSGALLSVIGWTSRFSIARTVCIWQAIRAAFHAQTAAFPAGFRMKLCLTGDNSRCYDDTVQKAMTGLAPK